jgi:hypothetical protein
MSCGCSSGSSYDGGIYEGVCNADIPYPSVSHESVPSLIDNLVYALYGVIEKDVTSGKVVWNIPCDPSNIPATINGIPRNEGEGLLCYIIRALNLTTATAGYVTANGVETLANKTLTAPVINTATINTATINNLTATGTLALPAGSVTSAMILNGTIVDADINAAAAIATSKLAPVTATGSTTARTLENRFADVVNVKDFGAKGDGVTDDTAAIQAAFSSGKDLFFSSGTYRITGYLTLSTANQTIRGSGSSSIINFDSASVANIQPAIVITQSATDGSLCHLTINHNGQNWATSAYFVPNLFGTIAGGNSGSLAGDARGVCLLVMADKYRIDSISVLRGWDNGIGVGNFNLTTGAQSAGPDQVKINQCHTFGNGIGKHNWGPAPSGFYNQGAGIDILTGTNFLVSNCTDFGSYGGFWCDITGGGKGSFVNCVAENTPVSAIWSDAATGSGGANAWAVPNNVFGGNITGAGAGWYKTPAGIGFYSGSYGVQFTNCTSLNAGTHGFVADFTSSANQFTSCRAVTSGMHGFVDAGVNNTYTAPVIEGAGVAAGTTSASGSVCPPIDAFLVKGSIAPNTETPAITNPVVKGTQVYPAVSPTITHNYCIATRASADGTKFSNAAVIGGFLTTGISGIFASDANCKIAAFASSGFDFQAKSINTSSAFQISSDANNPVAIYQDATGNFSIENYASAKSIYLSQIGNGAIYISQNGAVRARVDGTGFNIIPLASATPANNGDMLVQATSNTSLTFKLKGTDGTVRSASLTLS